jgi:hypothetical protein
MRKVKELALPKYLNEQLEDFKLIVKKEGKINFCVLNFARQKTTHKDFV